MLEEAEKLFDEVLIFFGKSLSDEKVDERLDATRLKFIYWTQYDKLTKDGLAYVGDFTNDLHRFHPWFVRLLSAYNGLGVLFMKMGRLITAEKLFQQALNGQEKIGRNATSFAIVVMHLKILYTRNGQYDKAENFLRRALEDIEKLVGPDHIMTHLAAHNFGILRLQQNRLSDAEQLILRTAKHMESRLGPVHGITLNLMYNQALLFRPQDEIKEAEELLEKTIKGWRESGADSRAKRDVDSKSRRVAKPEAGSRFNILPCRALRDLGLGRCRRERQELKDCFEKSGGAGFV